MKFEGISRALYLSCLGYIQVASCIGIAIRGSRRYALEGQPFTLTCTFNSTANAVRILQKNGIQEQSVQLSGTTCYNVQLSIPVACDISFCSCSKQGNVFTASWSFSINETNSWKCIQDLSSSQEITVKLAVPCRTVTLEVKSGSQIPVTVGKQTNLICVTKECRPRPYIQWYIGGANYTNSSTSTVINVQNEMTSVRSVLTFTPTSNLDKQTVNCTMWNIDNTNIVQLLSTYTLDVQDIEDVNGSHGELTIAAKSGIIIAVFVVFCGCCTGFSILLYRKLKHKENKNLGKENTNSRKNSTVAPVDSDEIKGECSTSQRTTTEIPIDIPSEENEDEPTNQTIISKTLTPPSKSDKEKSKRTKKRKKRKKKEEESTFDFS